MEKSRAPRRVHPLQPRRQLVLLEPDQLVHRLAWRPRRHLAPPRAGSSAAGGTPSFAFDSSTDAVSDAPSAPEPASAPAVADTASPSTSRKGGWWREVRGLLFILAGVFAVHSAVAKPFYIPSESMMPGLLVGDQLVVSKYPYGWSWASATFHVLPPMAGRVWGAMPERGDVVIVVQPTTGEDLIKRGIGLPGDTIAVAGGVVYLNARPIPRQPRPPAMIPIDANTKCDFDGFG